MRHAVALATLLALAFLATTQALNPADFKGKNVVLFLTDQERQITHFPKNWAAENLPGLTRLKKNALRFKNAFTAACMCTPARASLFSGYFPAQHGSLWTLESDMSTGQYPQQQLTTPDQGLVNMATVMSAAGYDFVYKGKMHLTKPSNPALGFRAIDALKYGFTRWNFPDAGANQDTSENGGPPANNDDRFMYKKGPAANGEEGVIQYLEQVAAKTQKPFFLVVSLVNPHDVLMYPAQFNESYKNTSWLQGDIQLPESVNENITYPYKPSAQQQIYDIMKAMGPLKTPQDKLNYINFYGNLMKYVDNHLVQVLNTLENIGKLNDTLVIRSADHGELGMAHGGLRQKSFVFYEEAIRVPLLFSNPVLFPEPIQTDALVSHVDLVPTLATLFNAPEAAKVNWAGKDYSSVIYNPSKASGVQDYIAFQFNDVQSGQSSPPYVYPPAHIVAIRESRYKIAKYFDVNAEISGVQPQFEMYDLKSDPNELKNIASSMYNRSASQVQEFKRLKDKLEYVEKFRLKPLKLTRTIGIFARTRNVENNETFFLDQSVNGGMYGQPIGKISNCSLYYYLNPKKSTAHTDIVIQSTAGIIRGVASLIYSTSGKNITFTGTANFTDGTGAYRGIKATGLNYTDTNTVSGQQGRVNITGIAYY